MNDHGWPQATGITDPGAGDQNNQPTIVGWTHLGYVVHLLEDLTSPPHTRNSAHPCVFDLPFCDPFEPLNNSASVNSPKQSYIDFTSVTSPQEIFNRVQSYTSQNYFSAYTVFQGGPVSIFEDADYFYSSCLPASQDFGTCVHVASMPPGMTGRKIAHKGAAYYATLPGNPAAAEVDSVIAHEQFAELGPVAVQAVAELIKYYAPAITVAIDPTGIGTGKITSAPSGIDCGSTCIALFVNGTKVQLTAAPDPGFVFSGWSGDCSGSTPDTTVVLNTDQTCMAKFDLASLTITKTGNGSGTVVSAPPGMNCGPGGPSQTSPFSGGVQLTEQPAFGSAFVGSGGDCASAGTNPTVQVTVSAVQVCTASFTTSFQLSISKSGNGTGTVTSVPAGISCGTRCSTQSAPFAPMPPVQPTDLPDTGSTFGGWGGDCSAAGVGTTAQVTLSVDRNCTATFNSLNPTVHLNPFGT